MLNKYKIIDTIFHLACILVTFSCVIWCLYNYFLDEDLSLVVTKRFGEEENYIKPSVSLCFWDPFLLDDMTTNDREINVTRYKSFLRGDVWDEKSKYLDFEKMTKSLEDYIVRYIVIWKNSSTETFLAHDTLPNALRRPTISYVGDYVGYLMKCYAIDLPIESSYYGIEIKNSIFPKRIRPNFNGFSISFHYPNQFLKSSENMRSNWPAQPNDFAGMLMKVTDFEVTMRRQNKKRPCNSDWRLDDLIIYRKLLNDIGCQPSHLPWNLSLPICDTKEKMSKANFPITGKRNLYPDPCQSAEKVEYALEEMAGLDTIPRTSNIFTKNEDEFANTSESTNETFFFAAGVQSSRFKLIELKKAYDLQSLIGNSGGYIGLFLGE